jgi:transcriptional regulator with XRE-family HTH domain
VNARTGDPTGWGKLLDELRAAMGLQSDNQLAEYLGVSRSFISSVRAGRRSISYGMGESIFEALGKPITEADFELFKPLRMRRAGRGALGNQERQERSSPFLTEPSTVEGAAQAPPDEDNVMALARKHELLVLRGGSKAGRVHYGPLPCKPENLRAFARELVTQSTRELRNENAQLQATLAKARKSLGT